MSDLWMICPACRGEGSCVNPSIDSHGLSQEDFDQDPDFAENYMSGVYDICCQACDGTGKIRRSHLKVLDEHAAERRLAAAEDGNWEAYNSACDRRWG